MNDEVRITCEICEDLLPLVEDHVASEESRNAVLCHIFTCKQCQNKYPAFAGIKSERDEIAGAGGKGERDKIARAREKGEQDIIARDWEYGEKDDSRILAAIRDKISIGLLLCISISLLLGVLIVVSSSSSPWLMLIIFPLICGFVYWTGGRAWRWVPPVAALFWIIITLLMHRNYVANWKAAILDSVVSAVLPLILCYVGALAAALLKYAFKGELK